MTSFWTDQARFAIAGELPRVSRRLEPLRPREVMTNRGPMHLWPPAEPPRGLVTALHPHDAGDPAVSLVDAIYSAALAMLRADGAHWARAIQSRYGYPADPEPIRMTPESTDYLDLDYFPQYRIDPLTWYGLGGGVR